MGEIQVDVLVPTSGAVPSGGYDPVSLAAYTAWELNDEARFAVVVPDSYVAGSDFYLTIQESSSSASAKNKWHVKTLLLRPGLHATDEETDVETFIQEYTSSAIADQLLTRTFAVTGSAEAGRISDVAITSGDVLSFTLKRIAAVENEDPGPIKVFDLSLSFSLSESAVSECAGRIGKIIDAVRDLFNEATGGFIADAFILRSINRCQQHLAQENYWRRETWIPALSGEYELDLLSHIADYQDIHQVYFSGRSYPMTSLGSFKQYEELKTGSQSAGTPEYYVVQNNRLYVWPIPNTDVGSGYCVYHSYQPADLTCSSVNPNPPVPKAHDVIFVYFALRDAFLRDRHAPGADSKFSEYAQLYEAEKQRLLGEGDPPRLSLRSYR